MLASCRLCPARRYLRNRATSPSVISFRRRTSMLSSKSAIFTTPYRVGHSMLHIVILRLPLLTGDRENRLNNFFGETLLPQIINRYICILDGVVQ